MCLEVQQQTAVRWFLIVFLGCSAQSLHRGLLLELAVKQIRDLLKMWESF